MYTHRGMLHNQDVFLHQYLHSPYTTCGIHYLLSICSPVRGYDDPMLWYPCLKKPGFLNTIQNVQAQRENQSQQFLSLFYLYHIAEIKKVKAGKKLSYTWHEQL